jgi:hypothetical protein
MSFRDDSSKLQTKGTRSTPRLATDWNLLTSLNPLLLNAFCLHPVEKIIEALAPQINGSTSNQYMSLRQGHRQYMSEMVLYL